MTRELKVKKNKEKLKIIIIKLIISVKLIQILIISQGTVFIAGRPLF